MREAGFNGKRITRTHFNGKSQVCNIELILMGEESWIQQEKKDNQESFQWEITGNHRFTILGLFKWGIKFEGSWIQQEKKR